MAKNHLEEGQHRVGWLIDGNPDTPHVSCTLSLSDGRIELRLPWNEPGGIYQRWFGGGAEWGDDPDRSKYNYSPPIVLWFQDTLGRVTLVGCRDAGSTTNLGFGLGLGTILVNRAVFGGLGLVTYQKIHGLRSSIPGMSQWLRLRSMSHEQTLNESGRLESLAIRLESPPPISLHRKLNLTARPSFGYSIGAYGDTSEVVERILIETNTTRLRSWHEHEKLHEAIRELVGLAAWKPFNLEDFRVKRDDDPERVLSGDAVGVRWAKVLNRGGLRHPAPSGNLRFLFTFDNIKAAGIRRWIGLRQKYSRGVLPVLDTLGQRETAIEVQVSQVGIGLDGIGYQLALDRGLSVANANRESHRERLVRLYDDLGVTLPFSRDTWASDGADAYNAVKHANRAMPSISELIEVRRMHQLIFRAWVAQRLGVSRKVLQEQLSQDPMSTPYEVAPSL